MTMRIGFGYDIHRLVVGRSLWLGCVEIAFEKGLLGHSDADVVTHALCDALLGAGGLGDIGMQFPDTDPKWKGAAGSQLLQETLAKLLERGTRPVQVDLTLLAEMPKIAPHRDAILSRLAEITGLDRGMISLKARTHEGLGAVGRGEAMAAYAMVTVETGG